MKLKELLEQKEQTLIGVEANDGDKGIIITSETKKETWRDFICSEKNISSLEDMPNVTRSIIVHSNKFSSLKGMPKSINGDLWCGANPFLISLKYAPESIVGDFNCGGCNLTSLEHAPKKSKTFCCANNRLTSLKDIHKHIHQTQNINATNNPIKSHVLGLLLIKGLSRVQLDSDGRTLIKVADIINKYLPNDRGHKAVAECQDELIEADFDDFAQI